ncbi:MAG: J domain-containing protein, partial [Opitutaceae bacterium]
MIDHERLQSAAWAEFHTARKRLDKTTRDLHRHEEMDIPAYNQWLHRTFPLLVTSLRELHTEVARKTRQVEAVLARASVSGGSLKRLWKQQKEREANPERAEENATNDDDEGSSSRRREADLDDFKSAPGPAPSANAKEIYRRLVQRLHPDRGGKWTTAREHLWHEVQRAWAAGNADWLARLEVDWETANEIVGPKSPLSRLRRAIEEIHAARRDTERKLREYRSSPPWRFSRNEKNRPALHRRTETNFLHDLRFLQRQLDHLNATIAGWEEDWTRADHRPRARMRRSR